MNRSTPGDRVIPDSAPSDRGPIWALAIGGLGALELGAIYLAFYGRLPRQVPSHLGASGAVNGWLTPMQLLLGEVALVAVTTVLFTAVLAWYARSAPLRKRHGTVFVRPLLGLLGAIVVCSVPLTFGALMWNAVGGAPFSGGFLGPTLEAISLIPVLAAILLLVAARGRRVPEAHDPMLRAQAAPVLLGVGPPIALTCGACGQAFVLEAVPLLAPHMALGGDASLWVRCARCGERGWCAVTRRLA